MGQRLYFPSEGRHAEDFFALKNSTNSVGFEPANLGTKGQQATSRPPKPPSWVNSQVSSDYGSGEPSIATLFALSLAASAFRPPTLQWYNVVSSLLTRNSSTAELNRCTKHSKQENVPSHTTPKNVSSS